MEEAAAKLMSSTLQKIYQDIDEMLRARRFGQCDCLLSNIHVETTAFPLLIGYLTITLPWKKRLPARADLYKRTRARARQEYSQARADYLLQGLE